MSNSQIDNEDNDATAATTAASTTTHVNSTPLSDAALTSSLMEQLEGTETKLEDAYMNTTPSQRKQAPLKSLEKVLTVLEHDCNDVTQCFNQVIRNIKSSTDEITDSSVTHLTAAMEASDKLTQTVDKSIDDVGVFVKQLFAIHQKAASLDSLERRLQTTKELLALMEKMVSKYVGPIVK